MSDKPKQLDYFQQALSCHQKGDLQNAKKYYEKDIQQNNNALSYCNLGIIYSIFKDFNKAKECYEKAIEINKNYAQAYYNLGKLYQDKKEIDNAKRYYKKAISANPNYTNAHYALGVIYKNRHNTDIAKQYFKNVVSLDNKHINAHYALGMIYKDQGNFEQAKKHYKEIVCIDANHIDANYALGVIYDNQNNFTKAKQYLKKTVSIDQNHADAHNNLGVIYKNEGNFEQAKKHYEKVLSIKPDYVDTRFNISLLQLSTLDYKNGFDNYRYRYNKARKTRNIDVADEATLLKKGQNIANKTLFITHEQGFGDNIQFIRFLPKFLEMRANIVCSTNNLLIKLFQYSYPDIKFIVDEKVVYDYNFPIMDSAYLLNITYSNIPYSQKYLKVDYFDSLNTKKKLFKTNQKPNVGLIWKSNSSKNELPEKTRDRLKRSMDLDLLLSYLPLNKYNFYSLQKDTTDDEEKLLKDANIPSFGNDFIEFYDNALVIDNLDLLISIDTVSALLSGAMGKKTFIMLPFAPDWRWAREHSSTNWFDSVTLFRQTKTNDWDGVLKEIAWATKLKMG